MKVVINRKLFIDYMRKNHLSEKKFAKKAGTTKTTVSRFINGVYDDVKMETLNKFMNALNLDESNLNRVFILQKPALKRDVTTEG